MSTESIRKQEKLPYVDGLRGVACFMVVLSHLTLIFYPGLHDKAMAHGNQNVEFIFNSPLAFFYSGTSAVYIFFVLSGFILSHAFLNGSDVISNAASMTSKRYFRLAIPVTISCIAYWGVMSTDSPDRDLLSPWFQSLKISEPSFFNALYAGTISSFFGSKFEYNPVLWTMKIELLGSFLTYFICTALIKSNKQGLLIFFFCLAFFLSTLNQVEKYGYISFLIGVYIYVRKPKVNVTPGIALIITGVYFGGIHYGSDSYTHLIYHTRFFINGEESNAYILFNFISGVLISLSVLSSTFFAGLFSHKLFVYTGKVSFSVYLFHLPFFMVVLVYIFNTLVNAGLGYAESAFLASIVSIIILYVFSSYLFKIVDRPSMLLSNRIAKNLCTVKR
jgi:peptidoglycan/LPS O-acetylase OafA/YrhL